MFLGKYNPGALIRTSDWSHVTWLAYPGGTRFSNMDPTVLYGSDGSGFFRGSTTPTAPRIYLYTSSGLSIGGGSGSASDDDRYWPLVIGGHSLVIWDVSGAKQVSARTFTPSLDDEGGASVSP